MLPPDKHHSVRADGEKPSSVFIISFEMVSEFFDHLGCRVFTLHDHMSEKLSDLVRECRQTYSLPMPNLQTMCLSAKEDALPGSEQMVRVRLEILLIELMRFAIERHSASVTQFVSAKSMQDDDIASKIMDILVNAVEVAEKQPKRPIVEVFTAVAKNDFSKFKLAKAFIRWAKDHCLTDLTTDEITCAESLISKVNKALT